MTEDDQQVKKINKLIRDSMNQRISQLQTHERLEKTEMDMNAYIRDHEKESQNLTTQINDRDQIILLLKMERDKYKDSFLDSDTKLQQALKELRGEEIEKIKYIAENEQSSLRDYIQDLTSKLQNNDDFVKKQEEYIYQKKQLELRVQELQDEIQSTISDKDREMILKTDQIQKNMHVQIQDIRKSILTVKQEQFDSTIRLTLLQNQQLSQELDYQSKQTELFLVKNKKLEEQNKAMQREIEIQTLIQAEIVNKRLTKDKVSQNTIDKSKIQSSNIIQESDSKIYEENWTDLQQTIKFFEKQQKILEKKYAKLLNDYDLIKNECQNLENKVKIQKNKFSNLASIIIEYLENNEDKNTQQLVYKLNIQNMQQNLFTSEEKDALLNIILQQIKPYINKNSVQVKNNKYITIKIFDDDYKPINNLQLPKLKNQSLQKTLHNITTTDQQINKSQHNLEKNFTQDDLRKSYLNLPQDKSKRNNLKHSIFQKKYYI